MRKELGALMIILVGGTVGAATYNFYFNSTEQGDHSNAQPSVTVNTEEEEPKEENLKTTASPEPGPESPEAPSPSQSVAQTELEKEEEDESLTYLHASGLYTNYASSGGAQLGFRFPLNSRLSLALFAAVRSPDYRISTIQISFGQIILGADLEWSTLGSFFEFGPILGLSSMAPSNGNWVSLHSGIFTRLNFGRHFAMVGKVRVNLAYVMPIIGVEFGF